jgi:NADH dehydrogenase
MILVAGGTGMLGRQVVAGLRALGRPVRVLTRDPAHATDIDGEVAVGDVRDDASLSGAAVGCTTVVSAFHGFLGGRGAGPHEIDFLGNRALARAAMQAGVEHLVLVSVYDARADHPLELHRAKHAAEQEVRATGLGWTILRPTAYVETWLPLIAGGVSRGKPAMVLGRGSNPVNFVSVHDVAALVVRAVADPTLRGRLLDVPGPDDLTMVQLAECAGARRIRHVPRGGLRAASMLLGPVAPAGARAARSALVMDTTDMTADGSGVRAAFPDLEFHSAARIATAWSSTAGRAA